VPGFFVPLWGRGFYEPVIAGLKSPVYLFGKNVENTGSGTPLFFCFGGNGRGRGA
jgi:hypothetical protein